MNVKHSFIVGRDTKVIDLKGDKGIIQSIDMWYDNKIRQAAKAIVSLYGRC